MGLTQSKHPSKVPPAEHHVLVCEDEPGLRHMLGVLLKRAGYQITLTSGVRAGLSELNNGLGPDAIITDLMMPDGSGMQILEAARARDESVQVLMVTAFASTEQAVEAMRLGAYDYLQKPFKNDELLAILEKALEKKSLLKENRYLREQVAATHSVKGIVGRAPAMTRVLDLVARIADAPTSVLITGESGTGKELIARALHTSGAREHAPFVAINCGALPENLMESELFGHEKGAFTGANSAKTGLFQAAQGGTLFLDEIGELSARLQVKLLRVLQERKVRTVGGTREIPVEVRVLAATNRKLEEEIKTGRFRQDLYYRLNVIHLALPALRERPEDIPLLAQHFAQKHARLQGKNLGIENEALKWLETQDFPGNVRELENLMERAVTLAAGPRIVLDDFPHANRPAARISSSATLPEGGIDLDEFLRDTERTMMQQALAQCEGNQTAAAQLLGMSFRSFRYRWGKHAPHVEDGSEDAPVS